MEQQRIAGIDSRRTIAAVVMWAGTTTTSVQRRDVHADHRLTFVLQHRERKTWRTVVAVLAREPDHDLVAPTLEQVRRHRLDEDALVVHYDARSIFVLAASAAYLHDPMV